MAYTTDTALQAFWPPFRDCVGRLSVRRKGTATVWWKVLSPLFAGVVAAISPAEDPDPELARTVIEELQATGADWCGNGRVDDDKAKAALRRAVHAVFQAKGLKDSAGEDGGKLFDPVEAARRTAELVRECAI